MRREIVIALRMAVATLILTGIVYPLAMTGVAQILFPRQANGDLVTRGGHVVGSKLIGQSFSAPGYFHGRPSSAGAGGYDATASGGSNLGPTSRELRDRVATDADSLAAQNPGAPGPIPVELVTASGSGLDPHVSPEAALWQAPRVAAARGISLTEVDALVRRRTEPRTFGILGEPRVNVLLLNLDLDARLEPAPAAR